MRRMLVCFVDSSDVINLRGALHSSCTQSFVMWRVERASVAVTCPALLRHKAVASRATRQTVYAEHWSGSGLLIVDIIQI
jgi:hypothetical protein